MSMRMELTAKLPFQIRQKGERFVASCPALDVVTQGETREAARENLSEALHLFLRSCIERGTLDAVLKECGFTSVSPPDEDRNGEPSPNEYLEVPLHLLSRLEESTPCRRA